MKDIIKWAQKMRMIGNYKKAELRRQVGNTTLHQRIALAEELLILKDDCTRYVPPPLNLLSLAKVLEQIHDHTK
jgi:hypothetical protein